MKFNPFFHLACIIATMAVLALFIMILWLAATLPGWVVFPLVAGALITVAVMYWHDLSNE